MQAKYVPALKALTAMYVAKRDARSHDPESWRALHRDIRDTAEKMSKLDRGFATLPAVIEKNNVINKWPEVCSQENRSHGT